MIFSIPEVSQKRKKFREDLKKGNILRFVGSFSPLVSRLIENQGFEGIYVSGAVISSDLTLPDLELINLSQLTGRGSLIVQSSHLPGLADADTGFGSRLNIGHTVMQLRKAGFCGLHLEDQQSPKKCGHLDNKKLISVNEMKEKIRIALEVKEDPDFLIAIRTDARGVEGLDGAIKRAKAYVSSGAEAIFPEALKTEQEFEKFREALNVPLIANMTEFGKSELISSKRLEQIGYNIILYPVTTWRLALKAVTEGLKQVHLEGHQRNLLNKMQTRKELYHLLEYEKYAQLNEKKNDENC